MSGWDTPALVEAEKMMILAARMLEPDHLLSEATALMKAAHSGRMTPVEVAKILDEAGVNHTLIGAHALAIHTGKPRATKDVDMVVSDVPKAAEAIQKAYPTLKTLSLGEAGIRFLDANGEEVLDLLKAAGIGRAHALTNQKNVQSMGGQAVKVGSLALMLALKYIAMRSESRSDVKKQQDLADFMKMIENHEDDLPVKPAASIIMKNNILLATQFMMDVKKIQDGGQLYLFDEDDDKE